MTENKPDAPRPEAPAQETATEKSSAQKSGAEKTGAETLAPAEPQRPAPERQPEPSLGKTIAAARERRGLSQGALAKEAHIPPYYVRMIESDDYTLIADQLYLLPFLRRYATFVGLDPEEVASRFIRDVQRADVSAARMTEPIPMAERGARKPWLRIAVIVIAVIAAILIVDLGYRMMFQARRSGFPGPTALPSASGAAVPAVPVAPSSAANPRPATGAGQDPGSGVRTRVAPRPRTP